jgi:chemotaxis protein CheD
MAHASSSGFKRFWGVRGPPSDVFLHAGQVVTAAESKRVTTILGSCVAVCLWDTKLRVGGMNHFLLPHGQDGRTGVGRFGETAMAHLIAEMAALGSRKRDLEAKVFGGACVLEGVRRARGNVPHVGEMNVVLAVAVLREEGIPVVARDVGGPKGRKVIFDTGDGTVWIRRLGGMNGHP